MAAPSRFLHDFLPAKTGVTTTFVDVSDLAAVERAFTTRTKMLYCEYDVEPDAACCRHPEARGTRPPPRRRCWSSTTRFAPLIVAPIQLGADVVVHSLTKFMNGASDHIAGAVCGATPFIMQLMDLHTGSLMLLGPTMDPQVAFDISLRLPHLGPAHGRAQPTRAAIVVDASPTSGCR